MNFSVIKKIQKYPTRHVILYLFFSLVVIAFLLSESYSPGDFHVYYQASIDLLEKGKNIYTYSVVEGGYKYFYGTFFAILIYPLTFLPLYLATFIWLLANVGFLVVTWRIIARWLNFNDLSSRKKQWFAFILIGFCYYFLRDNIHNGQITILIVYCCIQSIDWIKKTEVIKGSVLLALGVMIKILPVVLIPYLLYRGFFKAALYSLLFTGVFYSLPVIFVGVDQTKNLLSAQFESLDINKEQHILDAEEADFYCLSNWATTLLIEDVPSAKLPYKRNVADVSLGTLKIIQNLLRLLFIGLTLLILRSKPFTAVKSDIRLMYEISYILAIIPLIFPHQQGYSYLLICPLFAYILWKVFSAKNQNLKRKIVPWLVLAILLCTIYIYIGEWIDFYDHFKFLIYGTFILIGLHLSLRPEKYRRE